MFKDPAVVRIDFERASREADWLSLKMCSLIVYLPRWTEESGAVDNIPLSLDIYSSTEEDILLFSGAV